MCLEEIFNNIIETNKNPFLIETESIFKENGVINKTIKSEKIDLYKKDLILDLLESKNIIEIKYYRNKIFKIFGKRKELFNYISNLPKNNFIIIPNDIMKSLDNKVFNNYNNFIISNFDDYLLEDTYIIIGDKESRCIVNSNTNEFYIDKSFIKLIKLI